nr:Na/Pi cotransporter family protein [bacterium]
MDLISLLPLFGGIGLFLYGMSMLGTSLERVAGAKLESTLEKLTSNRVKGVALGAVVTAVIQSSAATVVMAVGFVNAGIMRLVQAVPVIMGANIGTTITGQILRLGDISNDNVFLALLKPSSFAPVCIAIGAAMRILCKKRKTKDIASILIGLGILFTGMVTMENTLAPLRDSESFRQLFFVFKNPLLGVLIGILVTGVLQSSSASVGVLQAISSTGTVTFSMAAPLIMGMNVGKCITVLIASIGTNKKAKRAVAIDIMINLIGATVIMAGVYAYQALFGFSFWDSTVTRGNIADFHSLFNIITTVLMFPFCGLLIKLSAKLVHDDGNTKIEQELALLDDIFLKTPSLALDQCKKVILSMGEAAVENFSLASSLLKEYDAKKRAKLEENETFLDRSETMLGDYLIKITGKNVTLEQSHRATEMMHTVGDLERVGDYAVNMAEVAEFNHNEEIGFSDQGKRELEHVTSAVQAILDMTMEAYKGDDRVICQRIEPLEETIDVLAEMLRTRHIERLKKGQCSTQSGISFVEALSNMERISDHCSNIAVHIIQRLSNDDTFDAHAHLSTAHQGVTEEYKALFKYYESLYCDPIR